jgi:hypothetical protein
MDETAFSIIEKTLKFYGLDDAALLSDVKQLWLGKVIGPTSSVDDIGIQLRESQSFKNRFPANEALAKAGKPQLTVSEYLRQEAAYKRVLQTNGMPEGFYDSTTDFQNFISNEVSPDELQSRIELGYQAVRNANPQVVDEFKRLYAIEEGELAAYFIDPTVMRPKLDRYEAQRQARAAQIAAQAQQQASMALSQQEAESLARSGITEEQARSGFGAIQVQQGLFEPQMAGEQAVSREEQIGATFGTNAAAAQRLATRRRRRQAEFETGGGFATSQQGVAGLRTVGQ